MWRFILCSHFLLCLLYQPYQSLQSAVTTAATSTHPHHPPSRACTGKCIPAGHPRERRRSIRYGQTPACFPIGLRQAGPGASTGYPWARGLRLGTPTHLQHWSRFLPAKSPPTALEYTDQSEIRWSAGGGGWCSRGTDVTDTQTHPAGSRCSHRDAS